MSCRVVYKWGLVLELNSWDEMLIYKITVGMEHVCTGRQVGRKGGNHTLKKQIIQSYFSGGAAQFDEKFVDSLFELACHDQQLHTLISLHSFNLLLSSQSVNKAYLLGLLSHPKYTHIAHQFISQVIHRSVTVPNRVFELFIIETLPSLVSTALSAPQTLKSSLTYLALKMRSFNLSIRLTALKALKALGANIDLIKEWDSVFKEMIPQMIAKQKLAREVSYTKGLFLHVLQDQFSEVRQTCIQVLIIFKRYINPEDLKLIIIYMLNDEHQIVREETLIASKHLKDRELTKEDLETIMMCLREKRANMRKYVYQTLSIVLITQPSLLSLILDKALNTLQTYKSDKKHIYRMLLSLGKIYNAWIDRFIDRLGILDNVQPNWRNISYKAKMILCYEWWSQLKVKQRLPFHFGRHMLYIKDVEAYLFEETNAMVDQSHFIDISKIPINKLGYLLDCQEEISQQFHRALLNIVRLKFDSASKQSLCSKLQSLAITFNIKPQETSIIESLMRLIADSPVQWQTDMVQLINSIIHNREKYEERDEVVGRNQCKISKMERNIVVSSKGVKFRQRVVLRCLVNSLISKEARTEYKQLVQLPLVREDDENSFYSLKLGRYSKVECVLLLMDQSEQVLSTYTDIKL